MERDSLVLTCAGIVNNLVKKYNNHIFDEDLKSVGMIAAIECVDRCVVDNLTDINQIRARCTVWAKNRILDEIYKEKLKYTDDYSALEQLESPTDIEFLIMEVKSELTNKQLKVFNLLLDGKTYNEIATILGVKIKVIYKHCDAIKEKIKN